MVARFREKYKQDILPELMEKFSRQNPMSIPRIEKIVINMGVGRAVENRKRLEAAAGDLARIAGQRPVVTRARRSVSNFKLRQGMEIGCKVTLRSSRMYEFLDRLLSIALPRVRDFRGLSIDSFDGSGNYSLGIQECVVFPELDLDKLKNIYGLDITIVTTAQTDQEALELLSLLGMPFRR